MMRICGLNKTTLLDYPGHVAAAIFLGGCNFRCPFCQNGDLVLRPESQRVIDEQEIYAFLEKRKGVLSGVCITGGEPTLEKDLSAVIRKIKGMGYLVKLDTNGYRPETLRELLAEGILDYIAMDVKNCMDRYRETTGCSHFDIEKIRESIYLIKGCGIDYEFRTTVVKELHSDENMVKLGKEIEGAKAYFLQGYQESGGVISPGFHSCTKMEMEKKAALVRRFVSNVQLRGVE